MSDQTNCPQDEETIAVHIGSGNVYADMGDPDANAMALKAGLAMHLHDQIKRRGLTQTQAARLTGIDQPALSRLMRGQFRDFSSDRMVRALTLLSADVELTVYSDGDQVGNSIRLHTVDMPEIA